MAPWSGFMAYPRWDDVDDCLVHNPDLNPAAISIWSTFPTILDSESEPEQVHIPSGINWLRTNRDRYCGYRVSDWQKSLRLYNRKWSIWWQDRYVITKSCKHDAYKELVNYLGNNLIKYNCFKCDTMMATGISDPNLVLSCINCNGNCINCGSGASKHFTSDMSDFLLSNQVFCPRIQTSSQTQPLNGWTCRIFKNMIPSITLSKIQIWDKNFFKRWNLNKTLVVFILKLIKLSRVWLLLKLLKTEIH